MIKIMLRRWLGINEAVVVDRSVLRRLDLLEGGVEEMEGMTLLVHEMRLNEQLKMIEELMDRLNRLESDGSTKGEEGGEKMKEALFRGGMSSSKMDLIKAGMAKRRKRGS